MAKPRYDKMYDPEKDKVRLFGVGRSGSTLVWNICRILDIASTVQQREFFETDLPVICTYRDWRDVVISTWRVSSGQPANKRQFNISFNNAHLQKSLKDVKEQIVELEKMKAEYAADQILFLQYERFYHDFEYIFDRLEQFLGIVISLEERFKVLDECHILSVQDKARAQERKVDKRTNAFSMVDAETRIHGLHVYYGMRGTWKYILRDKDDQELLTHKLTEGLQAWGYHD